MKLLITGICGFVGSTLAHSLCDEHAQGDGSLQIIGLDNLSRRGSEMNRAGLIHRGIKVYHGDLRCPEDVNLLPACDCVIDASANASVLAGVDRQSSSKQLFDYNLSSTIHLLEYCKVHRASFVLLSTSRVYSIHALSALPVLQNNGAFILDHRADVTAGFSGHGVDETFSTAAPISLYGASKLTSECIALEYGETFGFPVWVNRCGVLAGPGQFGKADQGIFSFWINSYLRRKPLKYIGFGGHGWQTRDALDPRDLVPLLKQQFAFSGKPSRRVINLGGGKDNAMSLLQLSQWCERRFGHHAIASSTADRQFDIPWMVMDSRHAESQWNWRPRTTLPTLLEQIAVHAEQNETWLEISGAS